MNVEQQANHTANTDAEGESDKQRADGM